MTIARERGSVTHKSADPRCILHEMARDLASVDASAGARCPICVPCDTPEQERAEALIPRTLGS